MNILVNLPEGFFLHPALIPLFTRLETLGAVRRTSCNRPEELLPHLQAADILLMWSWPRLTPEMLAQCPDLRFCAHLDIGQEFARTLLNAGLPVSVGRRAFSPAVSEMALTLILACLRRTSTYHAAMWAGSEAWVSRFPTDIDPQERQLTGRNVGLIGFGAIGQRLAELLAPFHCSIRIHDPFLPEEVAARFAVQNGSVDALIAHSEILVLCAAANPGTRHLLEARHIEALRPGAVLVNVCRASLVDNSALVARLQKGDLYAALDVFDKEPLPADDPLRKLPNVYLTPHRAGGILESVERILTYLIEDLEAFLNDRPRRHALTEAMLPALDA